MCSSKIFHHEYPKLTCWVSSLVMLFCPCDVWYYSGCVFTWLLLELEEAGIVCHRRATDSTHLPRISHHTPLSTQMTKENLIDHSKPSSVVSIMGKSGCHTSRLWAISEMAHVSCAFSYIMEAVDPVTKSPWSLGSICGFLSQLCHFKTLCPWATYPII